MTNSIKFELPIKIKPSINKDGYVIIDANGTEHFFYGEDDSDNLVYDGKCITVKDEDNKN